VTARRSICTFHLEPHVFGIDVSVVQEVMVHPVITRVPLAARSVEGVINLRGQIVTSVDLRRRLALPPRASDAPPVSLVVRAAGETVSFLVDRPGDVVEVEPAAFERPPDTLRGPARDLILGAYKLPSQLLLLLDPERCAREEAEPRRAAAAERAGGGR
jgi:purine-binding chemotaxis protein CheW